MGMELIVQLVLGLLAPSGLAAFVTAWWMRRKINSESNQIDSDVTETLTNASIALVEPLKTQIVFLTEQLMSANRQIEALTKKVTELTEKLDQAERRQRQAET